MQERSTKTLYLFIQSFNLTVIHVFNYLFIYLFMYLIFICNNYFLMINILFTSRTCLRGRLNRAAMAVPVRTLPLYTLPITMCYMI